MPEVVWWIIYGIICAAAGFVLSVIFRPQYDAGAESLEQATIKIATALRDDIQKIIDELSAAGK